MKRLAISFIIILTLTSCAIFEKSRTLGEIKGNKKCIELKESNEWKQISNQLGAPIYPLPAPTTGTNEDLTKNTRVYKNTIVIFYVEPKKIVEDGQKQYKEFVTKVEICE
jgi:hypothetical protein